MTKTVRGGVTRDALISFRHLIVPRDSCLHLAAPNVTTPGRLPILGKERCTRQLVLCLLLEECNSLGAQHHVPRAQFGGPPLPMGESQPLAVEICNDCG